MHIVLASGLGVGLTWHIPVKTKIRRGGLCAALTHNGGAGNLVIIAMNSGNLLWEVGNRRAWPESLLKWQRLCHPLSYSWNYIQCFGCLWDIVWGAELLVVNGWAGRGGVAIQLGARLGEASPHGVPPWHHCIFCFCPRWAPISQSPPATGETPFVLHSRAAAALCLLACGSLDVATSQETGCCGSTWQLA